jgi:hypothetical protein
MSFIKKSVVSISLVLLLLTGLSGCKTAPEMSPMQKRQITTRSIDGGYQNIFKAIMTVLQDNMYIIKDTKMDTGLILAEVNRETDKKSQFFQKIYSETGAISNKGTIIEVSSTVDKISETTSEVRLTIQEKVYSDTGGTTKVKQILDPIVYEKLFNDITVELKRREAYGK